MREEASQRVIEKELEEVPIEPDKEKREEQPSSGHKGIAIEYHQDNYD